ncbi:uncharacterized protein B0H64DRAFT_136597 [Chaetomium fimeti]|uniref:Early meiotic induction protein 1 n=1 Tax=Chaetomium fimeti TaxID=1854472 RepID=A0AAE0HKB5_9PEZI|nr:hypothetical protein B0H64DRAFT_136597 [Chaetomium fimeti]
MGWFWQTSSSPKPEGSRDSASPASTTPTPPTPTAPTQAPPAEASSNSADREMAMFMDMLLKDTQSSSQPKTQQPPQPPPSNSSSSWLPWSSTKPDDTPTAEQLAPPKETRTPQSLAMSEHLLPTSMSCRDAFDYAWHCHTPGSQWNAVYRYGSVRACSELWDDFWFCMRTKSYSPELKAAAVREHYRLKEEAKYGGGRPSSEDVWASREERVAPGTAFQQRFEAPAIDDAELQRMDAERRRQIREMTEGAEGNNR